jgi:hypothetical protein
MYKRITQSACAVFLQVVYKPFTTNSNTRRFSKKFLIVPILVTSYYHFLQDVVSRQMIRDQNHL